MSRWSSSVEIHWGGIMGQTISVGANSYIGAVVKREATLFLRRVTELVGIRGAVNDIRRGPRLTFVNRGTRQTRRYR